MQKLLTVTVAAPEPMAAVSYDIPEISKHVDFINVMTYDFSEYHRCVNTILFFGL